MKYTIALAVLAAFVLAGRPTIASGKSSLAGINPSATSFAKDDVKAKKEDKPKKTKKNKNDSKDDDPDDGDAGGGNDDKKKKNDGPEND